MGNSYQDNQKKKREQRVNNICFLIVLIGTAVYFGILYYNPPTHDPGLDVKAPIEIRK